MFDVENKDNPVVKTIVSNLESVISTLKTEIANIDEEYKKKLDEAKASLVACLEETTKQYEYWTGANVPVESLPKKRGRRRKTAVEIITGTNDESEAKAEDDLPFSENEEEKVVDMEATEDASEEPEFDGAGFTHEDNFVNEEEAPEDLPEDLPEEGSNDTVDSEAESEDSDWNEEDSEEEKKEDDEGWGEFPAEWK